MTLGDGPTVTSILLTNTTQCPGLTAQRFAELAAVAKEKCPISKALAAVPSIELDAKLID